MFTEKNHLLMIRDANYCMCGYERDFELDTQVITEALEKQLPIKVDYDNISIDAFGSNNEHQYGSSAYMLIYQKDVKKPVIIN